MNNLQKVQKAIEIQGYILVSVAGSPAKVTSVAQRPDGTWVTNLLTSDLEGYVRIKKTRPRVVAEANRIIANESAVRAERELAARQTRAWADLH